MENEVFQAEFVSGQTRPNGFGVRGCLDSTVPAQYRKMPGLYLPISGACTAGHASRPATGAGTIERGRGVLGGQGRPFCR